MTNAHTPGPWEAAYNGDPVCIGTVDGQFVAMTLGCNEDVGDTEDYANARLIAAAPAMLELLQGVLQGEISPERIYALLASLEDNDA